jgi:hypothetical protein
MYQRILQSAPSITIENATVTAFICRHPAKSLPTKPIPVLPSITERTTQLIPADDARAKDVTDSSGREG